MLRRIVLSMVALCASVATAGAVELPTRKAGLWELKMLRAGSSAPEVTMQHCTDEATDKQMTANLSPMAKENCAKNDTAQTPTGYVTDSVCTFGGSTLTSHTEITGDFNSGYAMKVTSGTDKPAANMPAENTVTLQAKWLGACAADQRPGDIVMPGGFRMNIKDMEKLKGLLPKQ